MLADAVQLAHEMRQLPTSDVATVLSSWDNLLSEATDAKLTVFWQKQDNVLITRYASLGHSLDVPLHNESSLISFAFQQPEAVAFDLGTNDNWPKTEFRAFFKEYKIEHAVYVPVLRRGEPTGVLGLFFSSNEKTGLLEKSVLTVVADSISEISDTSTDQDTEEDDLLLKSATILDAMTSAMAHYHALSHSNIDAANLCSGVYQTMSKLDGDNIDCSKREMVASLKEIDAVLQQDRDVLRQVKDTYQGLSEYKLEISKVDLGELRGELLQRYEGVASRSNVEFQVSFNDGYRIFSDRRKLVSMLDNLIKNSLDFTTDIKSGAKITVDHRVSEGKSIFEVYDNGVGMTEDTVQKARRVFFSSRESDGIGLFVADNFASQLGGSLQISSVFGEYTRVLISLPEGARRDE